MYKNVNFYDKLSTALESEVNENEPLMLIKSFSARIKYEVIPGILQRFNENISNKEEERCGFLNKKRTYSQ